MGRGNHREAVERKNFPGSPWNPSPWFKFLAFRPLWDTPLTSQVLLVTYGNPNGFRVLAVNNPALPTDPRVHSYLAEVTGSGNLKPLLWFLSRQQWDQPRFSPHPLSISEILWSLIPSPFQGEGQKRTCEPPLDGLQEALGSMLLLCPLHCHPGPEALWASVLSPSHLELCLCCEPQAAHQKSPVPGTYPMFLALHSQTRSMFSSYLDPSASF